MTHIIRKEIKFRIEWYRFYMRIVNLGPAYAKVLLEKLKKKCLEKDFLYI